MKESVLYISDEICYLHVMVANPSFKVPMYWSINFFSFMIHSSYLNVQYFGTVLLWSRNDPFIS